MSDLFGRTSQVYGGGITSDASYMFWSGMPQNGLGMLVSQMQIQYQQPVRRIYEVGPWVKQPGQPNTFPAAGGQPTYYVAGRPEGQVQLSRIVGPALTLQSFYHTYGNSCTVMNNLLFITSIGCVGGFDTVIGPPPSLGDLANSNPGPPTGVDTNTFPNSNNGAPNLTTAPLGPNGGSPGFVNGIFGLVGWYMNGCILTQIGLNVAAQDMLVNENSMLMFVGLTLYSAAGPGNTWVLA